MECGRKATDMSEDPSRDSAKSKPNSERNRNNNSNRGNNSSSKRYGTTLKSVIMSKNVAEIKQMNSQANNRFTTSPKPLLIPMEGITCRSKGRGGNGW